MKCLFCKQPCRLLRKGDEDYHRSVMIWFCDKHPQVGHVRHRVRISSYYQRKNYKKHGTVREWEHTEVQWTNSKKQIWRAYWSMDDENPGAFYVTVETPKRKKIRKPSDPWEPRESTALELEEWPVGFTPENVQKKVATYLIFS